MQVIFIRHGATAGNAEKRYIGRTDQPLSPSGAAAIRLRTYPAADLVFSSPLARCLQTAALIYPAQRPVIIQDLREMDFGQFENRNYQDLQHEQAYQKWLASGGNTSFPNGEHPQDFRKRCQKAFLQAMTSLVGQPHSAAFVVHGGTIMAILSRFAENPAAYFSYMTDNGNGYSCTYENGVLKNPQPLFK